MFKYLLLLFSIPLILFANVGKITALKGEVTLKRDTKNIPLSLNYILNEQDIISTGKMVEHKLFLTIVRLSL